MHWDSGWHMGWMGLWWLVILAVLIGVIWFGFSFSRKGNGAPESPEQALKRRYANGELDRETYEQMLTDLRR